MIDVDTVIGALLKLNLLGSFVKSLYEDLDIVILKSRLNPAVGGSVRSLRIENGEIKATEQLTDFTMQKLFSDMHLLVEFLHTQLPSPVSMPLSELLIPRLISLLITHWLSVNLPTDVKAIEDIKGVLRLTVQFANLLDSYRWCGKDQLVEWANSIPQVWLSIRRAISLDKVRLILARGLGESEMVERVETQMLSHDDDAFAGTKRNDDWNASWSDDDEANPAEEPNLLSTQEQPANGDEEEVNAWGFNDDTNDDSSKQNPHVADHANDEVDAWGWKDEMEDDEAARPEALQVDSEKLNVNGHPEVHGRAEREVTLRESYSITALPKQIFEIITQVIFDAEILTKPT